MDRCHQQDRYLRLRLARGNRDRIFRPRGSWIDLFKEVQQYRIRLFSLCPYLSLSFVEILELHVDDCVRKKHGRNSPPALMKLERIRKKSPCMLLSLRKFLY